MKKDKKQRPKISRSEKIITYSIGGLVAALVIGVIIWLIVSATANRRNEEPELLEKVPKISSVQLGSIVNKDVGASITTELISQDKVTLNQVDGKIGVYVLVYDSKAESFNDDIAEKIQKFYDETISKNNQLGFLTLDVSNKSNEGILDNGSTDENKVFDKLIEEEKLKEKKAPILLYFNEGEIDKTKLLTTQEDILKEFLETNFIK